MEDRNIAEAYPYEIAVIGGGVVGLAILRSFAMTGLRCILLERGPDILSGASKGNSALLHTGFDAPPGSLELSCIKAGYAEYLEIRERLNLPLMKCTGLIVSWTDMESQKLDGIVEKAHRNGITDVRRISRDALRQLEPALSPTALGAVEVPGEHVIDPWSAPLAYAHQALAHGAMIRCNTEVIGGKQSAGGWLLTSAGGPVAARVVINAAGNHADLVEAIARPSPFRIKPRRGQFVVFDKPAAKLVKAIILPVPTERTKGVLLFRTAFGNLVVGPTAEDVEDREVASTDTLTLERLKARAIEMVPELRKVDVNAVYAGLRPASQFQDYFIEAIARDNWVTVGGIRSTGLTAALGIAQHVRGLYAQHFGKLPNPVVPVWTPVPNLAEERRRPYEDGGEIICHCEWVTRNEIERALEGPLPAGSLGGLKRRTRAMMGRCQGFNCSAHVEAIMREKSIGAT